MGFYLRKSIKAGPFRVNLSKSGIGISAGIPGFRVGTGPRGNYVRMGRHGVYYRSTVGTSGRRPSSAVPARRPANLPLEPQAGVYMEDRSGVSVRELCDVEPSDLLVQINDAAARHRWSPWIALVGVILAGAIAATGPVVLVVVLVFTLGLAFWQFERDRVRKSVVVFYDVEDNAATKYQALVDAFRQLAACSSAWVINAEGKVGTTYLFKVNAGAGHLINRQAAKRKFGGPRILKSNIEIPSLEAGGRSVYFLPDRVLLRQGRAFADIAYTRFQASWAPTNYIETGPRPSDSDLVRMTWKYVNVGGGPDRRFKDNPQIPVLRYAELTLRGDGRLLSVWQFSHPSPVRSFAEALQRL